MFRLAREMVHIHSILPNGFRNSEVLLNSNHITSNTFVVHTLFMMLLLAALLCMMASLASSNIDFSRSWAVARTPGLSNRIRSGAALDFIPTASLAALPSPDHSPDWLCALLRDSNPHTFPLRVHNAVTRGQEVFPRDPAERGRMMICDSITLFWHWGRMQEAHHDVRADVLADDSNDGQREPERWHIACDEHVAAGVYAHLRASAQYDGCSYIYNPGNWDHAARRIEFKEETHCTRACVRDIMRNVEPCEHTRELALALAYKCEIDSGVAARLSLHWFAREWPAAANFSK